MRNNRENLRNYAVKQSKSQYIAQYVFYKNGIAIRENLSFVY